MTRPTLVTARLRLCPLTDDLAPDLVALNADPEVMRYVSGEPETEEQTLAALPDWVADQDGLGFWAGFEDDTFVGVWCLCRDDDPGVAELAYRLPRSAWGRGLATEGAEALLTHGFTDAGLDRVTADTMAANLASRAVLERLGLTIEETRPAEPPVEGWEQGEVGYAIDRATWPSGPAGIRQAQSRST